MKKSILILSLVLAGCGGGGDGTSPISAPTIAPAVAVAPIDNTFPDMRNIFSKLCGNSTVVQTLEKVDLNNDGRPDIILGAWCDLNGQKLAGWPIGSLYNGPVPNSVIALLQKADGTFEIGNQQLFGSDIMALEGTWPSPAIGDFNNDGRPDLAFSTNKEDGRSPVTFSDGTNNFTSHIQILLSSPNNTYKLHTIGEPTVSARLHIIKDNLNQDVLVFNDVAYKYTNKWTTYSYNSIISKLTLFAHNSSNYIVSAIYNNTQLGIKLMKQINNVWTDLDQFLFPNMRLVETYDAKYGVNGYTKQNLITINDVDWLIPSITSGCVISNSNNEKTIALIFEGIKLSKKYTGQLLEFGYDLGPYIGQIMLINIQNEKMISITSPSDLSVDKYFAQICANVNNDNLQDIIITRWNDGVGAIPYIFINNNGTFAPVSLSKLPTSPEYYKGNSSFFADLDNDSKVDLIYYPLLGVKPDYTGEIRLKLHKNNGAWN